MNKIVTVNPSLPPMKAALNRISFEELFEVSPVFDQIGEVAKEGLARALLAQSGTIFTGAAQIASISMQSGGYIVKFSRAGTALLKARQLHLMPDKLGRLIPKLVNSSGRIAEAARITTSAGAVMSGIANIAGMVVVVAHIISSIDISRKLDRATESLDFLIQARRMDQFSLLESVFRQARELAALPESESTRQELHRLGQDLFQLRATWRQELTYRLEKVKTRKDIRWMPEKLESKRRQKWGRKAILEIAPVQAELGLIDVCTALHMAVAQAGGTLDPFLRVSLPDELKATERVFKLVDEKLNTLDLGDEKLTEDRMRIGRRFHDFQKRYESIALPERSIDVVIDAAPSDKAYIEAYNEPSGVMEKMIRWLNGE